MAITKDLAPGDYTATYSKDGYDNVLVRFGVSSTGVVSCLEVDNETEMCGHAVSITGRKLTLNMDEWKHKVYTTSVVKVTPSKASYNVGEKISIAVAVKNTGNVATILSSKLKKDSSVLDTKNTSGSIAPGATATLTHTLTATSAMVGSVTYSVVTYHLGHPESGTKTFSMTVAAPCPTPTIWGTCASPASPKTGELVSFDQVSSPGSGQSITKYVWDFGDGSTGTGATPTHTYTTPGTRTVKLTVTNSCGGTANRTISVRITQATFTIEFASVPSGATITVT